MAWQSELRRGDELVLNGTVIIRNVDAKNIRLEVLEVEGAERPSIVKRRTRDQKERVKA